jgi:hypothetical protein
LAQSGLAIGHALSNCEAGQCPAQPQGRCIESKNHHAVLSLANAEKQAKFQTSKNSNPTSDAEWSMEGIWTR